MRIERGLIAQRALPAITGLICVVALAGCGGGSTSATGSTGNSGASHTPGGSGSTGNSGSVATARPGCGQDCQDAGASAGQSHYGYPCRAKLPNGQAGCLSCPTGGCMTLFANKATASNGVVSLQIRCNLRSTCTGALLICYRASLCHARAAPGSLPLFTGGRLAGSDFQVRAGQTTAIEVAITSLGARVSSRSGGYNGGYVITDLEGYGLVSPASPAIRNPTLETVVPFDLSS